MLLLNCDGSDAVIRTLKRRCLIREYDFNRVRQEAVPLIYDTAEFVPLSREQMEKEKIWAELQGRSQPWLYLGRNVKEILYGMKDWLYDERYQFWKKYWDDDQYLIIQARSNTPASRLGWGVFERTYDTKQQ